MKTTKRNQKYRKNNNSQSKIKKLNIEKNYLLKENKKLKNQINEMKKQSSTDKINKEINQEIIKLKEEIDKLKKEKKLLQKEYENKLNELERKLLTDFLVILDTLELSLNYVKNKESDEFIQGIKNTIKKFYQLLEKYDVKTVQHEDFKPEIHQAIGIETDNNKENNKIIKVIQKGFEKNNKLIRPGLVIVNKK